MRVMGRGDCFVRISVLVVFVGTAGLVIELFVERVVNHCVFLIV
jgi:hypothetical protein